MGLRNDRASRWQRAARTGTLVAALAATTVLVAGALILDDDSPAATTIFATADTPTSPTTTTPSPPPPGQEPEPDPVPASGPGTFRTAPGAGEPVGGDQVLRYRVQVEDGIALDPATAAAEVQAVLADPRGWTNQGRTGFRRVGEKGPVDFTVQIATPATVDDICGRYGLDTQGKVNCQVADTVVVNLLRWTQGSPRFPGPVEEYRALIVNHEVGHFLGQGHEGCPGPGRPAPAMMQQIDGLDGCVANAWPYDEHGTYLAGPPVP